MSGLVPAPLKTQPAPPWRVTMANAADARGRVGSSFWFSTAVGTTAIQVVAPAANVNGLILRTAVQNGTPQAANPCVYIGTSAPSAYNDTGKRLIVGTTVTLSHSLDIFIPPGEGLYAIANGAGYWLCLTWDVLP